MDEPTTSNASSVLADVGELDRATYIGGSRVAAVLGLDPYGRTPLTEYLSIIGEQEGVIDEERRKFFEWRKEWEPVVIRRVIREFDAKIINVNQRYRDQSYEFFAAEIDGEWSDEDAAMQNLEIKTVHPLAFNERGGWGEPGTSDVPVHYASQAMWGLGVTGRQACVIVAMAGIDTFVFYRIDRDDESIAMMRERCLNFWREHVLKRVPPAPVNAADCQRLAMRMRGRPVEADVDMVANIKHLREVKEELKVLEGLEGDLKFAISESVIRQWGMKIGGPIMPKDNAIILHGGKQLASWTVQETTRLDNKALREAMPLIYTEFCKTSTSRVLRLKKEL